MNIEAEAAHAEQVRRRRTITSLPLEPQPESNLANRRPVWGPGAQTLAAAIHHVDELILRALPAVDPRPMVVDLGCGAGASLLYLASRIDLVGEGLTLDPAEAALARQAIAAAGVSDRLRCREASYLSPPGDLHGCADLAFSIESFVHSPDPARYFQQASRTLRPGGTLIVCDDFLTPRALQPTTGSARLLRDLREARGMTSLMTVAQVRDQAAPFGLILVRDLDLTAHLEPARPRDRWLARLVAMLRPFFSGDRWRPLLARLSLQRALRDGLIRYRFLELQRRS